MEDRRNLFVIIFITFFVMVYVQWMFPAPPPSPPSQTNVSQQGGPVIPQPQGTVSPGISLEAIPSGNAPTAPVVSTSLSQQMIQQPSGRPSLKDLEAPGTLIVDTGLVRAHVSRLGARLLSFEIRGYKARLHDETPYNMVAVRDGAPVPLAVYADGTNDDTVLYTLKESSFPPLDNGEYQLANRELFLIFSGNLPNGNSITKSYVFRPDTYVFDVEVTLGNPSKDNNPLWLEWSHVATPEEITESANLKKFTTFDVNEKLRNNYFRDLKNPILDEPQARWAGIADYYFIESLISRDPSRFVRNVREGDVYVTRMASSPSGGLYSVYAGPKEMDRLAQAGVFLERSVDLGVFAFLAHPILALLKFCYSFTHNYGLAIILLTLLIKLGFLPLTQTSFKSMKAMQELQPEVQALRERISDPNVLNQELMALYKKRGVNPLGGCLPILIQIPVFLGLYNALLNSIELRHQSFALWINDLSSPERLEIMGIGVPLMILIMGASMFVQQYTQPTTMDETQKKIFLMMPVIFTILFIIHPMPSGLVLYWLVNNLISIVQQVYLKGHKNVSPYSATAIASVAMFGFGVLLTLI